MAHLFASPEGFTRSRILMHNSKSDKFNAILRLRRKSSSRICCIFPCTYGRWSPPLVHSKSISLTASTVNGPFNTFPSSSFGPEKKKKNISHSSLDFSVSLVLVPRWVSRVSALFRSALRPLPQFSEVYNVPNFLIAARSLGILGFIRFLG